MGGLVAANLAVRATHGELPPPLALMAIEPGKTWPRGSIAFHLDDLSRLPSSMLLLAVVGDDDDFVGEIDARKIYAGATAVPRANYIRMFSDDHGVPALVGDHRAPTAPGMLIDGPPVPGRLRGGRRGQSKGRRPGPHGHGRAGLLSSDVIIPVGTYPGAVISAPAEAAVMPSGTFAGYAR